MGGKGPNVTLQPPSFQISPTTSDSVMDWIEQYESARRALAICWVARDEIAMDGDDAVKVLHKLCSNDIETLTTGRGCEAFVCNVQGKIVSHLLAYRTPTGLRLVTSEGQAPDLIAHLDRYVIREDVQFQHIQDSASLYVVGPLAQAKLKELGAPIPEPLGAETWSTNRATCIVRRLQDILGCQIVGPRETLSAIAEGPLLERGAAAMGDEAWSALRIESFVPEYPQDISIDNLPQEVGRDDTAISFTKGCYLGQETVARIDAMGHVNWLLRGLSWPVDGKPQPSATLHADGKDAARITSVCFSPELGAPLALAYVRRQYATVGSVLHGECGEATVVSLPLAVSDA